MLLILMALSCVFLAYWRATLDLRRERMRERLNHLDFERERLASDPWELQLVPSRRAKLATVDAEIADLKQKIDGSAEPEK